MNKTKSILFLLLLLVACTAGKKTNNTSGVDNCGYQTSSNNIKGWSLIFEENFNKDLSKWNAWESGAFNEELQYYQPKNVQLNEGFLFISAKREKASGHTDVFNDTPKDFDFTSGRIESKQYFGPEATEGKESVRFSARLRLVEGHGMWPAWWSYNDPWPTKGEIDILEARGNKPFEFQSCFHYGAKVNTLETDAHFNEFHYKHPEKLTECFHVYELIWTRDKYDILFDGNVVQTYDVASFEYVDDFFEMKHKLVLNLAVGGWFFEEVIKDEIPDERVMVVDWVRVYER